MWPSRQVGNKLYWSYKDHHSSKLILVFHKIKIKIYNCNELNFISDFIPEHCFGEKKKKKSGIISSEQSMYNVYRELILQHINMKTIHEIFLIKFRL